MPVHSEEVSRSHAYILRTPQGFLLVDSSLHGTYVNAERVQAQRMLADGDVIQIGGHSFRFDLRSAEPHQAGAPPTVHEAAETSQYTSTAPVGARATGKLGLALALAEMGSRHRSRKDPGGCGVLPAGDLDTRASAALIVPSICPPAHPFRGIARSP